MLLARKKSPTFLKHVAVLLITLLVGLSQGMAQAQDTTCRLAEWGFGYIKVAERDNAWTYTLRTTGPRWRTAPNGYHSPGFLVCLACPKRLSATYNLFTEADLKAHGLITGWTAAERVKHRIDIRSGYWMDFRSDHLEYHESREGLFVGPLSGYAVLYRQNNQPDGTSLSHTAPSAALVISLSDGCITFETNLPLFHGEGWELLNELLDAVAVDKIASADTKIDAGGISVRPRPEGTEQRTYFKPF